jgi:hypothetical protein
MRAISAEWMAHGLARTGNERAERNVFKLLEYKWCGYCKGAESSVAGREGRGYVGWGRESGNRRSLLGNVSSGTR